MKKKNSGITPSYKRMPEKFKLNGFTYDLIERADKVAIYSHYTKDYHAGFEVHIIRVTGKKSYSYYDEIGTRINVSTVEHETLANDEEFGEYAWSFDTIDDARKKYNELKGSL